jgi:hypothetical protein
LKGFRKARDVENETCQKRKRNADEVVISYYQNYNVMAGKKWQPHLNTQKALN